MCVLWGFFWRGVVYSGANYVLPKSRWGGGVNSFQYVCKAQIGQVRFARGGDEEI